MVINKYTVTFNITPSDATVNYSIDSQTYNQTTTGTGTVSNVPHGSTIYYKISKGGYETITKSQVVNSDVTVTEYMNPTYYILVSTDSSRSTIIDKYTNPEGTETEQITIPASSTDYKVDGLMYGFKTSSNIGTYGAYITKLDTTYFNTSKVTTMGGMFYNCNKLTSLDVSNFDTSNVTAMGSMFYNCNKLTSLDVSNFDTSNVTAMGGIFLGCSSLTSLNVSNFDTSKVTNMASMFNNCSSLTSLDLSNFDISKVTNMGSMFLGCSSLTSLDLSNFDTSNVTVMANMFLGCSSLTSLNVSNFDTSKVTNMANMFNQCNNLTHIKCKQAFKNWCWTNQDTIKLPTAMKSGGSGRWEIVG